MSQQNKDLPAIPLSIEVEQRIRQGYGFLETGLRKREYAAIHILAGLSTLTPGSTLSHEQKVKLAVQQADALFLELDKEEE